MKRKRGHKKGKHKKTAEAVDLEDVPVLYDVDVEDDNDDDDDDSDLGGAQLNSNMEVALPVPVVPYQPAAAFTKPTPTIITYKSGGRQGIGPVKVRLKASKLIKPQESSPDMLDKSDTDKSSQHVSLEKQGEVEKTDDSGNSLPETQSVVMEKVPSKSGTLKIKSFRGSSSINTAVNVAGTPALVQGVRNTQIASDKVESTLSREPKFRPPDSPYSEEELNTSLMVIRKIMNMDAAEPFNVPVNPEALGIPDYFDIIHYPMDFGTICNNLEHGNKYKNSKDVFKDVQYIWENCYKYNNKGDYIVDLMRRVKKNFMKYWVAAGLYTERSQRANGSSESIQGENVTDKMQVKGTPSKQARKRHGMRQHKSDCLCAVCVMKRKRRERDAQLVENQIEISDGNLSQDLKQEETAGTPFSEDTSSNLEYPVAGADIDMAEQAQKMKLDSQEVSDNDLQNQSKDDREPSEALKTGDASGEEANPQSRFQEIEVSRFATQSGSQKNILLLHQEEPTTAEKLQHKQEELRKRNQQIEIYKKLLGGENPMLTKLCGNLFFSGDPKSVWSGPHSLSPGHVSLRSSRGINAALSTFMK